MKVVTASQMRQIDRWTIEQEKIPGSLLMENAGKAVFDLARELLGGPEGRVAIFCGKGNNGGDGLVVARHLKEWGARVQVFLAGSGEHLQGDARANFDLARQAKVPMMEADTTEEFVKQAERGAEEAELLVDALLGTGIKGEVTGLTAELISLINESGRPVVAVDVPSGIDSDTGKICGCAIRASHTVTMGLPKLGLLLYPGAEYAGELRVADIGLPPQVIEQSEVSAELIEADQVKSWLPIRVPQAHKGDFGRVLVIAGSVGMTGAAALASEAALRAGAGLVTLVLPESLNDLMEVKLTEVMTRPCPETADRSLALAAQPKIEELAASSDVVVMGPGLSLVPETQELIRRLIVSLPCPQVLDADALTALSSDLSILAKVKQPAICTPHPGEMGRLLGITPEEVQADRIGVVHRAANELKAVVVLKGARSLICSPDGLPWINRTGNPGMASGGTGDVLTGMIGGLLAQGLSSERAACAGVYLHGLAGDLAAAEKTQLGIIAGDLLARVPMAIKQVSGL